jgi:hypothetical protein
MERFNARGASAGAATSACPPASSTREADLELLYGPGKTIIVEPEEPPAPFEIPGLDGSVPNGTYPGELVEDDTNSWLPGSDVAGLKPEAFVYSRFPRGHRSPSEPRPVFQAATTLRAVSFLSRKTHTGAQVLICRVEERGESVDMPDIVVAKIFDPLFFADEHPIMHPSRDPVVIADMAYAQEAAAYERFWEAKREPRSRLRTSFQPECYGTYYHEARTENPEYKHITRPVRLIVMELIEGVSLADMCLYRRGATTARGDRIYPVDENNEEMVDPEVDVHDVLFPETRGQTAGWMQRMRIINDLADGLVRQSHTGVSTYVVSPTQVLVVGGMQYQHQPGPVTQPGLRVVLVDYSKSITVTLTRRGTSDDRQLPTPRSPRGNVRLIMQLRELCGWWPAQWRYNTNLSIWFSKYFSPSAEYTFRHDNGRIELCPAAIQHGYVGARDESTDVEGDYVDVGEDSDMETRGSFTQSEVDGVAYQQALSEGGFSIQ